VGKSVWVVLSLGAVAALLLVVAMMASLSQFKDTPAAMRTALAASIQNEFQFIATGTEVRNQAEKSWLRIVYEAKPSKDIAFSKEASDAEMTRVAQYAIEHYKGRDRTVLDEIRVYRSETHGRGCFQSEYKADLAIPNPIRKAPGEKPDGFPFGTPEPPPFK
jgi:hypothetical protein